MKEYTLMISEDIDATLTTIAYRLNVTKSDVLHRAIGLLKHAVEADEVRFITEAKEVNVIVK